MANTPQSLDSLIQEALRNGGETIRSLCEQYTGKDSCTTSEINGAIIQRNENQMNGPGGTLDQLCKEAAKGIPMATALSEAGIDPTTPMNCPQPSAASSLHSR
jgi:hypothetical protein